MSKLYRFVECMTSGRRVTLYYQDVMLSTGSNKQIQDLPRLYISEERFRELEKSCPGKFRSTPFRIVRDGNRTVDLEWS